MTNVLVRYWWVVVLRGLLSALFGMLALVWPVVTLASLVLFFGAYSLIDGVFAIVAGVQQRHRWGALLFKGLLGIGAAVVTFAWPGLTALALLYVIAAWAVMTGVLEVVAAIKLRKVIDGESLLALSGVTSIVFGAMLMIWPSAGALALVWLMGAYALAFAVLQIGLGLRLRSLTPPGHSTARMHEHEEARKAEQAAAREHAPHGQPVTQGGSL